MAIFYLDSNGHAVIASAVNNGEAIGSITAPTSFFIVEPPALTDPTLLATCVKTPATNALVCSVDGVSTLYSEAYDPDDDRSLDLTFGADSSFIYPATLTYDVVACPC